MIRLVVVLAFFALPAMAQDNIGFASPSGNIACLIGTSFARCDIAQMTQQDFTKPPADCPLDFGAAFEIEWDAAKGVALCYGDTVFAPDLPVLVYGQTISLGEMECLSQKTGMVCTNKSGHGFEIAKARQSLF